MRAWQVQEHGEPASALRLVDVDTPAPGPGQVLVRVRAAALNFPDVLLCRGQYQIRPPLPFTPGVELCGDVVELGEGVGGLAPGQRIIGTPALPTGALAEYALMEPIDVFPAPQALDDAGAAAMHIAYQTGWFALHRRANLAAGETLLVHAGAGGVGSAAIQLGKAAGATVIAVVGGEQKVKVAEQLGADVVIDRRSQDFVAVVKELTGGRGVDVVFDPVGGDAYMGSARCVAFEGRILIIGFAGGTVPAPPLNHVLIKNYAIIGLHWGLYRQYDLGLIREAHEALTDLAAQGIVKPLIGGELAMPAAAEGLTRLGAGETVGRLVVSMAAALP
jgi:NADPH:quinone reductase